MCTIEERYNNARSLMDQKKFKDAADEFDDNIARCYLGKWYMLNAADPSADWNAFIDSCSKQAYWLEKYMDNLEGGEDEEEIGYICSALASLYEEGLEVKKDKNKARYYRSK